MGIVSALRLLGGTIRTICQIRRAGVLGVTVSECSTEQLTARSDPVPFPEHVLIDFTEFGTNQIKKKSVRLRDKAIVRGWLFLNHSVT